MACIWRDATKAVGSGNLVAHHALGGSAVTMAAPYVEG